MYYIRDYFRSHDSFFFPNDQWSITKYIYNNNMSTQAYWTLTKGPTGLGNCLIIVCIVFLAVTENVLCVLIGHRTRERVTLMLFVVPTPAMNLLSPRGAAVYHTAAIGAVQAPFQAHFSRYCWMDASRY